MAPKNTKKTKAPDQDSDLPEGCEPLQGARVAGWFVVEKGNTLQGVIRDRFESKGKYGPKRVYKVLVTKGRTKVLNDGDEETAEIGAMVGLDEKGYLKKLADLENGREIYVKCQGKQAPDADNPQGVWLFAVGVFPENANDKEKLPF
jgi:hypothetical protein